MTKVAGPGAVEGNFARVLRFTKNSNVGRRR